MSRRSDVTQLLDLLAAPAPSADDPWTITRGSAATEVVYGSGSTTAADLGGSLQQLQSDVNSQKQIAYSDRYLGQQQANPASQSGSGIMGWLSNLFPVASGIAKLFGLGNNTSPPPRELYQSPPSISFSGALLDSSMGATSISYDQHGLPRTGDVVTSGPSNAHFADGPAELVSQPGLVNTASPIPQPGSGVDFSGLASALNQPFEPSPNPESTAATGATGLSSLQPATVQQFNSNPASQSPMLDRSPSPTPSAPANPQQIMVQVQAMDSQSFLDRSQDIAEAVRQAMLNLHSVNDVISDL